jgi:hypothetical protein
MGPKGQVVKSAPYSTCSDFGRFWSLQRTVKEGVPGENRGATSAKKGVNSEKLETGPRFHEKAVSSVRAESRDL